VLDWLRWDGAPDLRLRRPAEPGDFWRRAWVNGVSHFGRTFPQAFRISQDRGEGMIIHGARDWTDYRVAADVAVHLAGYAGLGVRVQGLRRYYGALLVRPNVARIVRVYDGVTTILAETPFDWAFESTYPFEVEVADRRITCKIGPIALEADDLSAEALRDGGVALVLAEGALSANEIMVGPVEPHRSRI
jgi:hypothetical protein